MHFEWALDHRMPTIWYMKVLSQIPVLHEYYFLRRSPRFARLAEIPPDDLLDWIPMRTIEKRTYTANGRLLLPGWFRARYLTRSEERAVYEYSAGKLRIGEVAEEVRRLHRPHATLDEVVRKVLIPTYEKLERTYHVAFHR
ncbi:MAG: hypothetical protein FJX76_23590 [Armatimonadetes bacterium]|nr:hypothetical protein [Armatimonadota bacterium]